ncbi:(4Fe-4S)-binding protein [Pontibacter sp. G13]|uniref:(4Fe-4S)-binding protein n=1 Tax=Pontibacter sp. G13 TaxID=3074898 RepID=UPI00288A376C|nr:(4Fe-4S)-binding protein [Pontibacter sp. G13]WNJ17487.1 (4Fe-4S)-binding protein [Pontibacter sp. G13]
MSSQPSKQPIKEYSTDEVTVIWNANKCIHSGNCVKGLSSVFNPDAKPWVNVQGASAQEIRNQIDQCPSGALSYRVSSK